MKCLILAAGDGTRMRIFPQYSKLPKSLIPVYGVAIIERIIKTIKKSDINDFIIVLGYKSHLIKSFLEKRKLDVNISFISNLDWETKDNAYSVYLAKKYLKEEKKFLMVMGDHLFDERIIENLIRYQSDKILTLVISREKALKEDTKVLEENGLIIENGKNLKKFNAVDKGIFLCQPQVFDYFEKAIKKNKTQISDVVNFIAKDKKADIFDISSISYDYIKKLRKRVNLWCIDIDTPEELKKAEKKILEKITKDPSDLVAKYFNYHLENFLTTKLSPLPISPNQVTLFVNFLAYITAFLFLKGQLTLAIILTFIVGVIDGVDGKLARLKMEETKIGEMEHAFDFLFESIWILALGTYFSQAFSNNLYLILSSLIISLTGFYRFVYDRFGKITRISLDMIDSLSKKIRRIAARRNIFNLIILLTLIINKPQLSLLIIFFLSLFTACFYTIQAYRFLKDNKKITK